MQAALRPGLWYEEVGEGRTPCQPEAFGDVVLARKDAPASYHLCVTHDDALQGVNLVTRGEDLRASTDLHRLLQALMGLAEPLAMPITGSSWMPRASGWRNATGQ